MHSEMLHAFAYIMLLRVSVQYAAAATGRFDLRSFVGIGHCSGYTVAHGWDNYTYLSGVFLDYAQCKRRIGLLRANADASFSK
jgi:hypothetical protein